MIELLEHEDVSVALPALRIIGGITKGNDEETQTIINAGGLPVIAQLVQHKSKCLRKESCWVLSNIAAGNAEQVLALLGTNVLPALVVVMKVADFEIKRECLWVISNLSSRAKLDSLPYIITCGVVECLCDLLDVKEVRSLAVILQSLTNLLKRYKEYSKDVNEVATRIESYGGLYKIESLQDHENQAIYAMSVNILEKYFDVEDDIAEDSDIKGDNLVQQESEQLSIFKF